MRSRAVVAPSGYFEHGQAAHITARPLSPVSPSQKSAQLLRSCRAPPFHTGSPLTPPRCGCSMQPLQALGFWK